MKADQIGIAQTLIIWLNVVILAFFWRFLAGKFAASDNPKVITIGGAMGASL